MYYSIYINFRNIHNLPFMVEEVRERATIGGVRYKIRSRREHNVVLEVLIIVLFFNGGYMGMLSL